MSVLLEEIRRLSPDAASALKRSGFSMDSDIQSLTRQDLHELLPGAEKLKLRRSIFEIIHKQKPINVLLTELTDFIPHESIRAALTGDGVLVNYLHILKDMKTSLNNVQSFVDAHIRLLDDLSKKHEHEPKKGSVPGSDVGGQTMTNHVQTNSEPKTAQGDCMNSFVDLEHESHHFMPSPVASSLQGSDVRGQAELHSAQTKREPQTAQAKSSSLTPSTSVLLTPGQSCPAARVLYQTIVNGNTFDAHLQFLDTLRAQEPGQLQLIESSQDYQIQIVFCVISSRTETDVDVAMSRVADDKPVILVLMHHTHTAGYKPVKSWPNYKNVELQVNVFYHEKIPGLLGCSQNREAAAEIQKKLLQYSTQISPSSSGNGLHVDAERVLPATAPTERDEFQSLNRSFESCPAATVRYRRIVNGLTFEAHIQFIDKLRAQEPDQLQIIESLQDYQIQIFFSEFNSYIEHQVPSAMSRVAENKPVILVWMLRPGESRSKTMSVWRKYMNIELQVNVFCNGTQRLLNCQENEEAASKIQQKLLQYSRISAASSGNAPDVGAERGMLAYTPTGLGKIFGSFSKPW